MVDYLWINAQWRRRPETPTMLASRFMTFLRLLRDGDPLTSRWYHWVTEEKCVDIADRPIDLPNYIAEGVARDDYAAADPHYGYHLRANNTPAETPDPQTLIIRLNAGSSHNFNTFNVETPFNILPSPEIVKYSLFRGLLLAIAEAFQPEFAYATPINLCDDLGYDPRRYARSSPMPPCWMIYLDPTLAQRAEPKPPLITEACRDGGLLMAATTEPFDTGNPAHRAGARVIWDVLDPLNRTVPFTIV